MDNEKNKKIKDPIESKIKKETKEKKSLTKIIFIFSTILLVISLLLFNKYVSNASTLPLKKIISNKKIQDVIETKEVVIYHPNDTLTKLVPSTVIINCESFSNEIHSIFIKIKSHSNYLIKGENDNYHPFMPSNIVLLNSYFVEDKLYLNISSNLKDAIYTKDQELLILYSLINTYTNIDGINKVKILIDDKEIKTLKWYNLDTFYTQNLDI